MSGILLAKDYRGYDRYRCVISLDPIRGWVFGLEAEGEARLGHQALFHPKRLIGAVSGDELRRITEVVAKQVHSVSLSGGRSVIELKNGMSTGRLSSVDAMASLLHMWLRTLGLNNADLAAVIAVPANFTAVRVVSGRV